MTIARQLEQKGVEIGIEKGIEKGIQLGERRGKLEMACALLQTGVDLHTVASTSGFTAEELARHCREFNN